MKQALQQLDEIQGLMQEFGYSDELAVQEQEAQTYLNKALLFEE